MIDRGPQSTDGPAPMPDTFEQALAELERLVAAMEGGELSLEASLAAYQRGAVLAKFCQERLASAEQQVRVLEGEVLKNFRTPESDEL
jgi:exodeoxyribonuclease VII small subunit